MPLDHSSLNEAEADIRAQANGILVRGVFNLASELKMMSPVDTGRFRGSWVISRAEVDPLPLPPGEYPSTESVDLVGMTISNIEIGEDFQVVNNVEYAPYLDEATHLPDHETGWVGKTGERHIEQINNELAGMVQETLIRHLG